MSTPPITRPTITPPYDLSSASKEPNKETSSSASAQTRPTQPSSSSKQAAYPSTGPETSPTGYGGSGYSGFLE